MFEAIVRTALRPLACVGKHPAAFYRGWRLVGVDGRQTSVSHTPQWLRHLSKAARRRFRAALAKVPWCGLVEWGTRAPLAVGLGLQPESEWARAHRLLAQWPTGCLWLADLLYGVGALVNEWLVAGQSVGSPWLVRARRHVKRVVPEVLADGSALVRVAVADRHNPRRQMGTVLVREIVGRMRRPGGARVTVRLGTSLLDAQTSPAREWLAL